jgi:hypothetical protein
VLAVLRRLIAMIPFAGLLGLELARGKLLGQQTGRGTTGRNIAFS